MSVRPEPRPELVEGPVEGQFPQTSLFNARHHFANTDNEGAKKAHTDD